MNRILILLFLLLTDPVMADSYFCDNSIHARTLNVSWTQCPIHGWGPYIKALYDGQSMDGVFHGRGTYKWEDGSVYIGWWRDGKMHGQGTLTFANEASTLALGDTANFSGELSMTNKQQRVLCPR